ncbi:unnamed protein product [Rhodiola kirilowii]
METMKRVEAAEMRQHHCWRRWNIDLGCQTIDAQFDVTDFGAVGDGETDDSDAFSKAWKALCGSTKRSSPTLVIPDGTKTFLLYPLQFNGPCKSPKVHVQINGTLIAPEKHDWTRCADQWILFSDVKGLIVDGSGGFDGQGATWWGGQYSQVTRNTRKNIGFIPNRDCSRPAGVRFKRCTNLHLIGIRSMNSIKNHFSISESDGANISGIHIEAPADSPNTDGIDISSTQDLVIENSFIGTGDDCIAVNGGVKNLTVDNVFCGPGHGISIGSLGKGGSTETVEDVTIQNCNFSHVQNGARIKTWAGGNGYVRRITYINITLDNARRPIIIDQYYCPNKKCDCLKNSSLQISDVSFLNFQGTTASLRAITLNCSSVGPGCTDTILDNVQIMKGDITSSDPGEVDNGHHDNVYATCNNAHGKATSTVPDVPCLD